MRPSPGQRWMGLHWSVQLLIVAAIIVVLALIAGALGLESNRVPRRMPKL